MHVPCCLCASQWFCPSFCGVLGAPTWDHCCFFISPCCYMHTNTEECNDDFLNECTCGLMSLPSTLKNSHVLFSEFHKLQFCIAFAFLKSKPVLMSWLKSWRLVELLQLLHLFLVLFPLAYQYSPAYLIIRFRYGPAMDQAKYHSRKLLVTSWTIWKDQSPPTTERQCCPAWWATDWASLQKLHQTHRNAALHSSN